jgi:hypothetical protein
MRLKINNYKIQPITWHNIAILIIFNNLCRILFKLWAAYSHYDIPSLNTLC